MPEPWLRVTLTDLPAVPRQILHALELAAEDALRWSADLTEEELNATPFTLPSVSFQMIHMARSLDRLLTYAEGRGLSELQLMALRTEHTHASAKASREELSKALATSAGRILAFATDAYEAPRWVGRDRLPSTLGGLLVHCAEHTQRHTGQLVTTAKVMLALRSRKVS